MLRHLRREWKYVWQWPHLAFLSLAMVLAAPGVADSIGLTDRSLLVLGLRVIPLLPVPFAVGLILKDAGTGTLELLATTPVGVTQVWWSRFTLLTVWCAATVLVFVVPLELRAPFRHGAVPDTAASVVDMLVVMACAVAAAHTAASEAVGISAGIALWLAGTILGIMPPADAEWLSNINPLSVYVRTGVVALLVNRLAWISVVAALLQWQLRRLEQSASMLRRVE